MTNLKDIQVIAYKVIDDLGVKPQQVNVLPHNENSVKIYFNHKLALLLVNYGYVRYALFDPNKGCLESDAFNLYELFKKYFIKEIENEEYF